MLGVTEGSLMLASESGGHVVSCSGYDCVSHMAMPNQSAPLSSKEYDLFVWLGLLAEGSLGRIMLHFM
jgi:hypothetical protein